MFHLHRWILRYSRDQRAVIVLYLNSVGNDMVDKVHIGIDVCTVGSVADNDVIDGVGEHDEVGNDLNGVVDDVDCDDSDDDYGYRYDYGYDVDVDVDGVAPFVWHIFIFTYLFTPDAYIMHATIQLTHMFFSIFMHI